MPLRGFHHVLLFLLMMNLKPADAGRQVEGYFTKKLPKPGYYLITSIPIGAKSINVTELSRTINFLAIKLKNGTYLFNDNYNIGSSGRYETAGTTFIYIRRNEYHSETFYAAGPLNASIDVMLIYQHREPKIFYQYELPEENNFSSTSEKALIKSLELETSLTANFLSTTSDNAMIMLRDETRSSSSIPKKKRRKRKFMWTSAGYANCSKPCGGGYQSKRYICITQRTKRHVSNKKCAVLQKPRAITVRCNNNPCAPRWEGSQWSKCSVTCGNGTRRRDLNCIKQMPENLQIRVPNHECATQSSADIVLQEPCHMPDCNIYTTNRAVLTNKQQKTTSSRWKTEEWSTCSATCGNGTKTRIVKCIPTGRTCDFNEKPVNEEICNEGDCKNKSIIDNEIPEALTFSSWLYSDWPEKCTAECGHNGTLTRRLFCENSIKNDTCDEKQMPDMEKTCTSDKICGQWFIGPWTKCSSSCDAGIETRQVTCISRFLDVLKVVKTSNCFGKPPITTRECQGPPCNATWFMSDWTECSRSCDRGIQKREVQCIGSDGIPTSPGNFGCDEKKRPPSKRHCNDFSCSNNKFNDVDNECRDILLDCWSIRAAKHKCQTEIYKKGCCKACRFYSSFRTID